MLDPEAPDAQRDKIVADARARIESSGTIKNDTAWGVRNMAYEIRRRTEADYRFFRFQGEAELLNALDHELKIADGVLRFRIFKVDARSPVVVPPPPTPGSGPPARPDRREDEDVPAAPEPAAEDGAEAEAEPAAESEAPAAELETSPEAETDAPAAEAPTEVAEAPAEVAEAPVEDAEPQPEEPPASEADSDNGEQPA